MTSQRTYTVAVFDGEADEGGYWAEVLDLPGCVAQGDSLDDLRVNLIDAIRAWEETMAEILADENHEPPAVGRSHVATWSMSVESSHASGGLVGTAS